MKGIISQPKDIAQRLNINVLVILRDRARTKDFRKNYLYLLTDVDKICCLRSTRITQNDSSKTGLLLNSGCNGVATSLT